MPVVNLLPPFALRSPESLINAPALGTDFYRAPMRRAAFLPQQESLLYHGGFTAPVRRGPVLLLASGSSVPKDPGVLRTDAGNWMAANRRGAQDAYLVKFLAETIRQELWRTLAEGEPTTVSRTVFRGGKIFAKITQTGEELQNYQVTLFTSQPPYMHVRQMQWELDLRTGTLEPIGYAGHDALEWNARTDVSREFGPFYRRVRFQSSALTSQPLAAALPEDRRRLLSQSVSSVPPREETAVPAPRAAAPEQVQGPTAVLRDYHGVRAAVLSLIDAYCRDIQAKRQEQEAVSLLTKLLSKRRPPTGTLQRDYLIALCDLILRHLFHRERISPEFGKLEVLHVWIRNALSAVNVLNPLTEETGRNVEVGEPKHFVDRPVGPSDILLVLQRGDRKAKQKAYATLQHQKIHWGEGKNADALFLHALGVWPYEFFLINLDPLSIYI